MDPPSTGEFFFFLFRFAQRILEFRFCFLVRVLRVVRFSQNMGICMNSDVFVGWVLFCVISVGFMNNWFFRNRLKLGSYDGFKIGSCGFDFLLEVEFSEIGLIWVDPMLSVWFYVVEASNL